MLTPLGLSATIADPAATPRTRSAQGHAFRRRRAPDWQLDGVAGAGVLRSTAHDLLRYLRAQLEPDSTPLGDAIRLTQVLREPGRALSIGLGWLASSNRTGPMLWHNGGTGGYRSFAGFRPGVRRAAVVLVNDQKSPDLTGLRLLGDS